MFKNIFIMDKIYKFSKTPNSFHIMNIYIFVCIECMTHKNYLVNNNFKLINTMCSMT